MMKYNDDYCIYDFVNSLKNGASVLKINILFYNKDIQSV